MQCEVIVLLLPQTRNPDVKISQQIDYNRIRNPHVRGGGKKIQLHYFQILTEMLFNIISRILCKLIGTYALPLFWKEASEVNSL